MAVIAYTDRGGLRSYVCTFNSGANLKWSEHISDAAEFADQALPLGGAWLRLDNRDRFEDFLVDYQRFLLGVAFDLHAEVVQVIGDQAICANV